MSSKTAFAMLVSSAVPTMINAEETVGAMAVSTGMMVRWFTRHGFRADGAKCAYQRWLTAWVNAGLMVQAARQIDASGATYWFTEVPTNSAIKALVFAENSGGVSVYTRTGALDKAQCDRMNIPTGRWQE